MLEILVQILKTVSYIAPFVLLCVATRKVNLNPADRGRQFLMPIIAFIYCIFGVIFADLIGDFMVDVATELSEFNPQLAEIEWTKYRIYVFNTGLISVFIILKAILLPILKRVWERHPDLMEKTSGICYEYNEDFDKWFLRKEYGNVKFYYTGIYYSALAVSTILFVTSQVYSDMPIFATPFYPVFGLIVLGEAINFLSGITKTEFVEDILGEDEESFKIANYGLLRGVLRDLFSDRILYDTSMDNGMFSASSFDTLEEMCRSEEPMVNSLGRYFTALKEFGKEIDPSYVKSCVNLVQGQSTLFCNPFYRDLTDYIMFPMIRQLMKYRKCLIVMGRDSSTDDVKAWLEEGVYDNVHTDSLWKVEVLTRESTEADIAIIKFCDLYNLEIQKANEEFLKRVGFVFIIEPSKLLATGQMGLSLLVNHFDESKGKVVYGACDRNCDGLVDALSHTLRTNITEVTATTQGGSTTSLVCWEADGEYMHHKIFSNVSRYLGVGTEINAVAMKYQIANTAWISGEKFPVLDMKWVAGQYYKKICKYTNLPVSQEAFEKAFHVESSMWNMRKQKNAFLVVEDEFQNLFELTRLFSTRAEQQGFINIVSENYLLRDYMLDNVQTFITDPKAIPTIVADYSRTERNTVLKLIMRMAEERVSEDEIIQALEVSGIDYDDPFEALKKLIYKHCFVNEINVRVYFKDELLPDALRSQVKKYYSIEGETEIARYAENLKNAYYIAEDEKGETYHIGAKLYGHIFQALVPGQFLTFAGKYYEVQSITPQNGVVVRRAADHINGRKYYRQIRHITLTDWKQDENVGGSKTIADLRLEKGYCQIRVDTDGYLEMQSYDDLKTAQHIHVSGIPQRTYRNKLVLKIILPGASENIRYTICLLLNEIFRTTYPDSYPYISAVTPLEMKDNMPENLKYAMYTVESDSDDNAIYIVEDSEIDLGLIISVERNIKRYFEIITEVLRWHDAKMHEKPEKEAVDDGIKFDPATEEEIVEEAVGFFKRILQKLQSILGKFFKKKPKPTEDEPEEPTVEGEGEAEEIPVEAPTEQEESEGEATEEAATETEGVVEPEASVEETQDAEENVETALTEPEIPAEKEKEDSEETAIASVEESEEGEEFQNQNFILRSTNFTTTESEPDIEGEDEKLQTPKTKYQQKHFLQYGYDDVEGFLDLQGTVDYLTKYGYDKSPLSQVREKEKEAEQYQKVYDPHKDGAHFCDFCGVEIVGGEYELLQDGRERCNQCSVTALRTGEEFKKVFKTVMRNMEMFYGIKFNVAIKVRMTDAKTIARHFGEEFVATPGFDGRTLGFAQKDSTGYSIYVENGSPKLAAMATIAHELTHIWQYQNWDDREITRRYGSKKLEIYEGMAKWAEIQYLLCINEVSYARRQEIITMMRDDPYGRGFIRFRANYPLKVGGVLTGPTPFHNLHEPLSPAYLGSISGVPFGQYGATGGSSAKGAQGKGGAGTGKGGTAASPKMPISRASNGKGILKTLLIILLIGAVLAVIISFVNGLNADDTDNSKATVVDDKVNDDENVTDDTSDDTTDAVDDEKTDDENVDADELESGLYYAYNQLSDADKEVYEIMLSAIENFETEVTEFPEGVTYEKINQINDCLYADQEDIFWYQSDIMTYYEQTTGVVTKVEINYCMTQAEAEEREAAIKEVVDPFLATMDDSMSDYEIALTTYDYIIQLCDYDSIAFEDEKANGHDNTVPDNIRSLYGIFVENKAVCVGYARAMQHILREYGIECTMVWNDDHAWNHAKLDGEYYYIDATWGDGSNTLEENDYSDSTNYDYFCLTSDEMLSIESHTPKDAIKLPECTATEYNYYVHEGLLVDSYNYATIQKIVEKHLDDGNYEVKFRCTSKSVQDDCLQKLVNEYHFPDMIEKINASSGRNISTQYSYRMNEDLYTMTFFLTE